jgi:hypothetical protein
MAGALVALLSSSGPAAAQGEGGPNNPFILLLHGIYSPGLALVLMHSDLRACRPPDIGERFN